MRPILSLLIALALAACAPGGTSKPEEDPRFAGLEAEILNWRADLEKTDPVCKSGGGCQDYEVACKGERPLTPQDQAKGVTAKVVAAMTFNPKSAGGRPGSASAEFTRTQGGWTRSETNPVNLSTCAAF